MTASLTEQIIAAVDVALGLLAEPVHRARIDSIGAFETPCRNLMRGDTSGEARGDTGQIETLQFDVEHHTSAATSVAAEQAADALHMASHAALFADPTFGGLCRGLRCIATRTEHADADRNVCTITATYRAVAFVRPRNLAQPV